MAQVAIRNISKEFKTGGTSLLALDNVSCDIADGEFVCVVGHSGCGKTTLLNILAGFLPPTGGEILIDGKSTKSAQSSIGVVFQEYALFPWRTALRNVEFGLETHGVPRKERAEQARHFLDLVRLSDFADTYPHQLSGGMRQRVAVARAMAYDPALLLMDEPFGSLDAQTRERLQTLVQEIWQKTSKTIFYVTHNLGEAVFLAERIVIMASKPGRIRNIVRVDLPRPRDPLSAEFIEIQRAVTAQISEDDHGGPDA